MVSNPLRGITFPPREDSQLYLHSLFINAVDTAIISLGEGRGLDLLQVRFLASLQVQLPSCCLTCLHTLAREELEPDGVWGLSHGVPLSFPANVGKVGERMSWLCGTQGSPQRGSQGEEVENRGCICTSGDGHDCDHLSRALVPKRGWE